MPLCSLILYFACDQIEKNEMGETCSTYGTRRRVNMVLVGKCKGKRPFGRPRRRWEGNNRLDFQGVGCGVMDWIELAHVSDGLRALANAVMNLQVP
jgi:hypothetical protein